MLKKREGKSRVTSVSVSKEFDRLMDDNNISPTEAIRRGVAVMLYDQGVQRYSTKKNKKRSKAVEDFFIQHHNRKIKEIKKEMKELKEEIEFHKERINKFKNKKEKEK